MAPVRTCVGCRRPAPAEDLIRIVLRPDGSLAVGRSLPGRGAWLCRGSTQCLDQAQRRRGLDRALRATLAPGAVDDLRRHLAGGPVRGEDP
ncbi:MAG TPA: YlxR family protein [Acidimicrobiales bacterium]|nr:YlxR family protein [Acidimicrobiales bacterium]